MAHRQWTQIEGTVSRAKVSPSGKMATFAITCAGDRGSTTIQCKTFDLVDAVERMADGQTVVVGGKLRNEKYTGNDGVEKWQTSVVVESIDDAPEQSSPPSGRPTPVYGSSSPAAKPDLSKPVIAAEDIPF